MRRAITEDVGLEERGYRPHLSKAFIGADKKPLVRGTDSWERRELERRRAGNSCLSFGSIEASNATHGLTAMGRRYPL